MNNITSLAEYKLDLIDRDE